MMLTIDPNGIFAWMVTVVLSACGGIVRVYGPTVMTPPAGPIACLTVPLVSPKQEAMVLVLLSVDAWSEPGPGAGPVAVRSPQLRVVAAAATSSAENTRRSGFITAHSSLRPKDGT